MSKTQRSKFPSTWIAVAGACAMAAAGLSTFWSDNQPPLAEATAAERSSDAIAPANAPVQWFDNLEQALAEAERTDKPILIDFVADWCPPCRMMDKHVWPREEVQSMLRSEVVPLRIAMDGPKPPREAIEYGVEFLPTVVLANTEGEEIDRVGYVDQAQLLEFVRSKSRS